MFFVTFTMFYNTYLNSNHFILHLPYRNQNQRNLRMMLDKANLPTKPQDFQIRVVVHEARNLFGGNLHPVTNVQIGKQGKHTRVQRSTAKPKWEEVFSS